MSGGGGVENIAIPPAISLPLLPEEAAGMAASRTQSRAIRSVRLGEITIKYGAGTMPDGSRIIPSELKQIAPQGRNFAYDTIFSVTFLRYGCFMQREEIQRRILKDYSFHLSTGSISQLSLEGLAYLEQCHFAGAEKLAAAYREKCFFIHLDGTNEGGEYTHFVVREGMSGNILYSAKIPSESEDSIVPVLEKVKSYFGIPDAVISDMSEAIKNAVAAVFKGIPHRLCHFHFLKAIGKDLLTGHHQRMCVSVKSMKKTLAGIRNDVAGELKGICAGRKNEKMRSDIEWLLSAIDRINDCGKDLGAEGFPFDLQAAAFCERCAQALQALEQILQTGRKVKTIRLCILRNRIQAFLQWLRNDINQIAELNKIFCKLRSILHPETVEGGIPLNWGMHSGETAIRNISTELELLRIAAVQKANAKSLPKYLGKAWKIVGRRLTKQCDMLDPCIAVRGKTVILPGTNNLSETGFRDAKRRARRTTGKKNLSKHMDELPAQYFYIFNLDDQEYVRAVYGKDEIFDSFHLVDKKDIDKTVNEMKTQRKAPNSVDYKLIRQKDYIEQLVRHFHADIEKK